MNFTDFPEANVTYGKPQDMTDDQCGSLRVFRGYYNTGDNMDGMPVLASKWLTSEGKPVWLFILGHQMPPVSLEDRDPFEHGWLRETREKP